MKKMWRRTLAGLLAMSIVIGAAPADIGGLGLLGGTAITAQAYDSKVFSLEGSVLTIYPTSHTRKTGAFSAEVYDWYIDAEKIKDFDSKDSVTEIKFAASPTTLIPHAPQLKGDVNYYYEVFKGFTYLEKVDFKNVLADGVISPVGSLCGMFKDCKKLEKVSNLSNNYSTDMHEFFSGCTSLTTIENFDISKAQNVSGMFSGCTSLSTSTISGLDTSSATNMSSMFKNCTGITSLEFDSKFKTAKVTNMSEMFAGCSDLTSLDLSNFNTAKVTNMSEMFAGCSDLTSLDLRKFNTANVKNMNYMFGVGSGNLDTVEGNATLLNDAAKGCESLSFLDLSSFDVKNDTLMEGMFSGCKNLQAVCVDATKWSHNCKSNYTFFSCFKLRGKLGKRYTGSGREIYADFAHIDTENSRGLLSTIDDYKLKSDPNGPLSDGETDYYKGYSNFSETGKDYLYDADTWFYQLTDVPAVAPTVNSAGNIAYSKATINDTEENYTFNGEKNVYTAVDNVTIPQIKVEEIAEVPATYGKNGTKAYFQGADGNKYILNDNGQYVATTDKALVIPMTGKFTPVAATEASWTTPGNIACYQGGDGNYYKLNEDGSYTQLTDAERVIPAILGTHYPATPADYQNTGNTEYYVGTDGKYYAPDGNGGYAAITENSWVTPKLEMYMQASPNSSTSAVDVNIYAAIPDGAKPQDYTISFGDVSMTADNCKKVEKTVNGTTRDYYLIKVAAPAKNMKDMYTYSIKHGDVVDKSGEASIRGYADAVIAGTYSDAIKKSCRAMLAYGAAAQNYKGYKTNDLAVDNNLSGTDGLDYSGINLPTSFSFDRTALNTKLTGASAPVTYYGMGLDMDADTHINFAFKVNEGLTQDAAIEYVNENIKINGKPVKAVANGAKFVVIKSEGIMISDLLKDLSLSFGETDYAVNVKQYMTSVYNRDDSQDSINLKNVCKALLNYYNCVTGATQNVY